MPYTAPHGYVDISEAVRITGLHRVTISKHAAAGNIPGAIQRTRKAPWYFTVEGLRRWIGITDEGAA